MTQHVTVTPETHVLSISVGMRGGTQAEYYASSVCRGGPGSRQQRIYK